MKKVWIIFMFWILATSFAMMAAPIVQSVLRPKNQRHRQQVFLFSANGWNLEEIR